MTGRAPRLTPGRSREKGGAMTAQEAYTALLNIGAYMRHNAWECEDEEAREAYEAIADAIADARDLVVGAIRFDPVA